MFTLITYIYSSHSAKQDMNMHVNVKCISVYIKPSSNRTFASITNYISSNIKIKSPKCNVKNTNTMKKSMIHGNDKTLSNTV